MEEDDEDALVLANALEVEQCGSLSVLFSSLGLAHALDSLQVVKIKWRRKRRVKMHLHMPRCLKSSGTVAPLCPPGIWVLLLDMTILPDHGWLIVSEWWWQRKK